MRILLFPSDRGGGFGHVSRCLALAQEAKKRGHHCAFVLSSPKYEARVSRDFPVFLAKPAGHWAGRVLHGLSRFCRHRAAEEPPLYTAISGLDYQVVRDGLVSQQSIEHVLERYRSAVKAFRPGVLIGDTNFLVWMLSCEVGIPAVQIVRFSSHPLTAKLIWWEDPPADIVPPDSCALFNPILEKAGLQSIQKSEDLFRGDLYVVPSIPEIEPIYGDTKTQYVGGLMVADGRQPEGRWSEGVDSSAPIVYVTIGGGAGPVGNDKFFSSVVDAFAGCPAQVVVSTGGKFKADDMDAIPSNVRFFDWVPGRQMISRADLVVCHGGYGTMIETIAAGKPSIVIPFHSEQEGNGRRLERLGCGRVLRLSNGAFKRINATWPLGQFSYLIQDSYDLTPSQLKSAADEILEDPGYSTSAKALQGRIAEYGGPSKAVELIESFS